MRGKGRGKVEVVENWRRGNVELGNGKEGYFVVRRWGGFGWEKGLG